MGANTAPISRHIPWLGTAFCLASAAGYTGANICLRQLAEIEADPAWVICLKETMAVVVLGPWLVWQAARGARLSCQPRALLVLIAAALAVQLIGNLGIQWSLGLIGLVVSLPTIFGALLVSSAVIGVVAFHESLGTRSIVAVATVIASVVLLSIGATGQDGVLANSGSLILTSCAIVAAGIGGVVYAGMGAVLRYAASMHVPVPLTVVIVTGTGTISLGILCVVRLGPAEMLATDRTELAWIIASGLCNVMAFSLITKGIQLTTLAHANILNASQVALGALAGVILFHEPYNGWLLGGVVLTVVGIVLFNKPRATYHAQ